MYTRRRLERGVTEDIRLITNRLSFHEILGASGIPYTLYWFETFGQFACTCSDYIHRRKMCKHLYFWSLIVRGGGRIKTASTKASKAYNRIRKSYIGAECPICLDVLDPGEYLTWCAGCGTNFHFKCQGRWLSTSWTCSCCRRPWNQTSIENKAV